MEHFELHPYLQVSLFGVDLSITKAVVMMWIACAIVFFVLWAAGRRTRLVPTGLQNAAESLVEFLRDGLVVEVMGKEGLSWFPFIATLFLFILVCNLLGLVPGAFTATSKTGVTVSLAIIVFLAYHLVGIKKHGPVKYFLNLVPSGLPVWLIPFMAIMEVVSHLARPLSLAIRLFANMAAGHVVILVFTLMAVSGSWLIKWLPFSGTIVMGLLEMFVAFIQAYIFAILAAIYIGGAIHIEH